MFEYLQETTFTKDLQQQEEILAMIESMAPTEPGEDMGFDDGIFESIGELDMEPTESEVQEEELQSLLLDEEDEDDGLSMLRALYPSNLPDYTNIQNHVDIDWLKTKSQNVKLNGLNSNLSRYMNTLPQKFRESMVATSGNDDQHEEGSEHYRNNAVDLRYNEDLYKYIQNDPNASKYNISLLNPNHGTAKHLHLQTKQAGGELYADTPETIRRGLNDPSYNSATLDLTGTNTIRGLDNYQPVSVTDGSKYEVLTGPNDVTKMTGKVYEQRMQAGGETIKKKSEGLGIEDWWNNREDVQATYKTPDEVDPFFSNWFKHPATLQRIKDLEITDVDVPQMVQDKLKRLPVYNAQMMRNVKTSDYISNHRLQGFPDMDDYDLQNRLNWIRPEYGRAGVYRSDIHATSVNDWEDKPVVAHELTHASGIQPQMDYIIDKKFRDRKLPRDPDNKTHMEYLDKDGMYPRVMEIRRALNLKPGQTVTREMLRDAQNVQGYYDMKMYYDDDTIAEILNTIAKTNGRTQSNIV